MASNLGWVIIRIPFDVPKVWGTRGMLKVKGEINSFAFRTSLFPTGKGYHYLLVNKRMQAGAHAAPGDPAHFRLEPDTEKRLATVPAELQRILNEDRSFRRWFDQLNYSTRKWVTDLITNVKSAAARLRRAEQVAEQLLSTMEAERELPPVLKLAFARDPRAFAGWQRMSPLCLPSTAADNCSPSSITAPPPPATAASPRCSKPPSPSPNASLTRMQSCKRVLAISTSAASSLHSR